MYLLVLLFKGIKHLHTANLCYKMQQPSLICMTSYVFNEKIFILKKHKLFNFKILISFFLKKNKYKYLKTLR